MVIKDVIGIDIGKKRNEARIQSSQLLLSFDNSIDGFKKLIKWVEKSIKSDQSEILFAFEHTGLYSFGLSVFLTEKEYSFILIPGLQLRRSMGITRGKNDKIDAKRIANYAWEKREKIKPYTMPKDAIIKIKRLLSTRERLVKDRAGYKSTLKEFKLFLCKKENKLVFETHEKLIKTLTVQIDKIEHELDIIIKDDEELKQMYGLILSVKGVGKQTALFVIAITNGFKEFDSWRKLASYAGIAPFPNTSGISVRGKTKVSHLANKKLKSLLDMCAKSAIQSSPEMRKYYKRRTDEGKSKMSTINIIRNKLLARIFAVVNRKTPYVDTMKYAA